MKNKKSLLSFGLLALVLVLGVGYAVVSNVDLTIGGSASVEEADLKVSFKSVEVDKTSANENIEVNNTVTDGAIADTFTISKMALNDEVVLTYTVQNKETDVAATLTEKDGITISNDNEEYFSATSEIVDSNIPANGGTTTVKVTVKLIKTPVESSDSSASFDLTLNAAPVNNAN